MSTNKIEQFLTKPSSQLTIPDARQFITTDQYQNFGAAHFNKRGFAIAEPSQIQKFIDPKYLKHFNDIISSAEAYGANDNKYRYGKVSDQQIAALNKIICSDEFYSLLQAMVGQQTLSPLAGILGNNWRANVSMLLPGGYIAPHNCIEQNSGAGVSIYCFSPGSSSGGEMYLYPRSADDEGIVVKNLPGKWLYIDGFRHRAFGPVKDAELRYFDMEIRLETIGQESQTSIAVSKTAEEALKKCQDHFRQKVVGPRNVEWGYWRRNIFEERY